MTRVSSFFIFPAACIVCMALSPLAHCGVIYWGEHHAAGGGSTLYRANIDGTNKQTVISFANSGFLFDIDNVAGKVYAMMQTGHNPISFYSANLDGTNPQLLSNSRDFGTIPIGMVQNPENGDIYVNPHSLILDTPGGTPGGMQRVTSDGTTITTLQPKPWYAYDMEVDTLGDKVYFTERLGIGSGIHRMNYDGSSREQVLDDDVGLGKWLALDLANDAVFYTRTDGSDVIFRLDLNTDLLNPAITSPGLNIMDVDLMPSSGKLVWIGVNESGSYIQTGDSSTGEIETSFEVGQAFGAIVYVDSGTVPEPTTLAIFGFGALGLAGIRRRKKKAA